MAEMVRNPDYLKRHLDARDRVRNLETGVHPTGGELRYYDTIAPTIFTTRSACAWQSPFDSGVNTYYAYWQRRTGLVMLTGRMILRSGSSIPTTDEWTATLPVEARPMVNNTVQVSADSPPYRARLRIETDGKLYMLTPDMTGSSPVIYLDGAMWAVN